MRAADELGIMFQVEPPVARGPNLEGHVNTWVGTGSVTEQEWTDILRTCRKHPSVVIYCCGNEELLNEAKIDQLRAMGDLCRANAPDALFNPQEALRGIEYVWNDTDLGDDAVKEPYPHNPRRLELVREFADVLGQYAWGYLSYLSLKADWRKLDERLAAYEKPILSHENGIQGSYLDLGLEHRYQGTRIGSEIYSAARRYLKTSGLLPGAATYFRNSCAWMHSVRKHNIEMARKCRLVAGYDYLGAIDNHWHRSGYTCGIMNEFYEMKPGCSRADVIKYNGESVLLLDHTNQRNMTAGESCEFEIMASLYGQSALQAGVLTWYLADSKGRVRQRGEMTLKNAANGRVGTLGKLAFTAPDLERAKKITLFARLSGGDYEIVNDWDFWVFPQNSSPSVDAEADDAILARYGTRYEDLRPAGSGHSDLRVLSAVRPEDIEFLESGGRVVLLGGSQLPTLPTEFQIALAGRAVGNYATVIEDHHAVRDVPHDGYCDWQFYSMLEGGSAVVFNELEIPFDPIIGVVSSFKLIRKQANLFEL